MNIYMDISNTKKMANQMQEVLTDFNDNISKLNNIIDNISNDWRGTDATSFIDTMRNVNIVELTRLHDTLTKYISFLEKVPTTYQLLDEIYTSKGIDI